MKCEQPTATEGLQRGEEVEAAVTFGKIRQGTCEDGTGSHPHGGVARSRVAEKMKSPGQGKRRKENRVRTAAQKALVRKVSGEVGEQGASRPGRACKMSAPR